jgi:hypothetical protein
LQWKGGREEGRKVGRYEGVRREEGGNVGREVRKGGREEGMKG